MRVTDAWLIYVLIVLGVFILLSFCGNSTSLDVPTKLFFSFLVGVVVILILIPGIVALPEDRTWYSLLLIFSFLAPLLLALWMIWSQRWGHIGLSMGSGESSGSRNEYNCEDGVCQLARQVEGNNVYNYNNYMN